MKSTLINTLPDTVGYAGIRNAEGRGEVWRLNHAGGEILDPDDSLRLVNHSPDGFNWGYPGSGPSQLAAGILFDFTHNRALTLRWYQQFKTDFVAKWADTWKITADEIQDWIARQPRIGA